MRSEKQLLVDEIKDDVDKYHSFIVMKYSGLTANQANKLRREVAKTGGSIAVIKKRILKQAMTSSGIDYDSTSIEGHVGLIFVGKDPILATKTVFEFGKENEGVIEVVGGHLEGKILSSTEVETLSKLPGKETMRAQFLATLEAPLSQTLAVMEAILTSVVYCLDNKNK